ncbi:CDP-glycerol glycerophosphotransferase family protein [Streptococcus sp. A11]|uniref:Glycerophosphotransferase n=1 Tax=Streptococcus suis TaxID=1307 RepID=A0A1C9IF39_STRSU|nr:Glycerophosphotransferase [Streptococcus suis]AOP02940.1 Glycerophosphotransferase [Streptococcus suis]
MKKKIDYMLKHSYVLLYLYRVVFSTLFRFLGVFVKTNDKLVLFSAHSRKYNDSPRVIYEAMIEDSSFSDYQLVWAVDDIYKNHIPGNHLEVKTDTFEYFLTCLRAKYWITSVNIERGLSFKKKNTIFLNTWHGIAINKMGNDVGTRNDFDWSNTNYVCYSNDSEIDIYRKAFNTRDSAMIPSGLPRNDELYTASAEKVAEIKNRLGIPLDKKVILYAPTWRDSNDLGDNYELTPPIDWKKWENELKDDYVLLLRTHSYTTKLMDVTFNDFLLNYTDYPKINDLLIITDILISDYSSIQLDYCILEKPMFCFGYDYEEYAQIRGFYYDLEKEIPNGVVRTEDDLLSRIVHINFDEQIEKTRMFKSKHVQYGGDATNTCIDLLFKK